MAFLAGLFTFAGILGERWRGWTPGNKHHQHSVLGRLLCKRCRVDECG
jgi:hypothetical protein